MSCGVGHRGGLDPMLLWLWCRPEATALIRPLAWELPYAIGVVLRRQTKTETKKQETKPWVGSVFPLTGRPLSAGHDFITSHNCLLTRSLPWLIPVNS